MFNVQELVSSEDPTRVHAYVLLLLMAMLPGSATPLVFFRDPVCFGGQAPKDTAAGETKDDEGDNENRRFVEALFQDENCFDRSRELLFASGLLQRPGGADCVGVVHQIVQTCIREQLLERETPFRAEMEERLGHQNLDRAVLQSLSAAFADRFQHHDEPGHKRSLRHLSPIALYWWSKLGGSRRPRT